MLLVLKILNFRTSKFCHQSGIIKVEIYEHSTRAENSYSSVLTDVRPGDEEIGLRAIEKGWCGCLDPDFHRPYSIILKEINIIAESGTTSEGIKRRTDGKELT